MSTVQSAPTFQISPSSGGHGLTLSETAARRLEKLGRDEGHPVMLRVAVDGGGCSGFQYRFELVEAAEADDIRIEADGQAAVVDAVSLPFLKGSEIAFVDDLAGAQFVVRNPNAASSCGCGVSFSI
ncbi:iron-sulfur cluster insertion protein ErpA [Brevundimonas sp.]|uniref:iron-sulfur cluster insertion protein ErpA n=1 Tax=Brevundimonas sp. TaxID=1871086 RepID=UPI002B760E5A|nr:iron-sulfur cluster insertion protein ErpA [Brevundimonas sp.]HWQ86537.1 iron-sulfur cluster insertion protein ErpA [Brevundimonas sp.]